MGAVTADLVNRVPGTLSSNPPILLQEQIRHYIGGLMPAHFRPKFYLCTTLIVTIVPRRRRELGALEI